MNASRAFFDTNVLLYMYSDGDHRKHPRAEALYAEYAPEGLLLLSTQVIQEFFAAGIKKLDLPRAHVQRIATAFMDLPLVIIGPRHIQAAMDTSDRYQISFWDALILAAAESGGADVLFTENLNHGQRYGSVLAQNPFLPA